MVLAFVLSILSSRSRQPESVIQIDAPAGAPAPQPILPGTTDEGGAAVPPVVPDTSGK
jgi:hypothetical protein